MLDNKVIVYDDSCPMCKLYTYWFVAWGFLKPENRIGFATAPPEVTSHVNLLRGRHEIPLFDRETKETIYGLDALAFVLASKWGWLKPFFRSPLFKLIFYPIYQVITYNRRVMAGCQSCEGFDCAPDLHRFYRSVYLGLVAAVTMLFVVGLQSVGATFGTLISCGLGGLLITGGLVGTIIRITEGQLASWNFFGNYATVTLMMVLVLLPALLFAPLSETLAATHLAATVALGLSEFRRRGL